MRDQGGLSKQNGIRTNEKAISAYSRAVRLSLRRSKFCVCAARGVPRDWEVTNTTGVVILLAHLGPLRLAVASEGAAAHVDACHADGNLGI